MSFISELVSRFNALSPATDCTYGKFFRYVTHLNQEIWNGSRHLGTTILDLLESVKQVNNCAIPYVLETIIELTGEPKYEHPKVYELLSQNGLDIRENFETVIRQISLEGPLLTKAFSRVSIPKFMNQDDDVNVGKKVGEILSTRTSEVSSLIRQVISEALISIDGVANDSKFVEANLASSFIGQIKGKEGKRLLESLVVLGGYSLLVGSQTMMDLRIINALGSAREPTLWPEIIDSSAWSDLVKRVYVVTSGRGRSENWVFYNELMAMGIGKKSVNIGHFGGGAVEPLDIYRRVKQLGKGKVNITNYEALSLDEFDRMAAYSRYVGNPVEKYEKGLDSDTLEEYPQIVDHRLFDLRSPDSILKVYPNEVELYDLILSIHAITPHLLPRQRLSRLADMFTMTNSNEGVMVVGGWGTSNPVGCNRVVLQKHGIKSEVISLSMGRGIPKEGRTAISIIPVNKRDFQVQLPSWETPIKSRDFYK